MKFYLDFGHGGKDSGAVGFNGTFESNVVLKKNWTCFKRNA